MKTQTGKNEEAARKGKLSYTPRTPAPTIVQIFRYGPPYFSPCELTVGIYFLLTSPTHFVDLMCSSASVNLFHFKLLPFRERYLLWNLGERTLRVWLFSWISKSLDHSWNVRLDCSIKAWKFLSCGNKNDYLWVFIGRIIIIIIGTGIVRPMPEAMAQHRSSGTVKPPVKTPNRKRILVSFNNLKNIFASFEESRRGFYLWLFLLLILSTCAGLDLIFSHGKIISACLKIYVSFAFALFVFFLMNSIWYFHFWSQRIYIHFWRLGCFKPTLLLTP